MSEGSNNFDNMVIITGAARSGTSMVGGVINMCGAFGGNMSPGNRNNEKGMFENMAIRNHILKPYLRNLGLDALGQYPLPDVNNIPIPADWRNRVEEIFNKEGYDGNQKIFYKGAKACLTWPVWNYAFPNAKWIIVRRKTSDIVNSCIKTSFMRAFQRTQFQKAVGVSNERDGWLWWVRQHEQRFVEMINEGLNCKIIWPDRMVRGDYSQLYDTIEWLGLTWSDKISNILEFIDPKLWHSRQSHPFSTKSNKVETAPRNKPKVKKVKVVKSVKPQDVKLQDKGEPFNPIRMPANMGVR